MRTMTGCTQDTSLQCLHSGSEILPIKNQAQNACITTSTAIATCRAAFMVPNCKEPIIHKKQTKYDINVNYTTTSHDKCN